MTNIIDDTDQALAARLGREREARGWSLAELAERSGVSKAMLSKVERAEASPTANTLARIATAYGLTLANLLTFESGEAPKRLSRAEAQPVWQDPETGYIRKQIFADPRRLELAEIILPAGRSVAFPASAYSSWSHVIWVVAGRLEVTEGHEKHVVQPGDRLQLGEPADVTYSNVSGKPCRYLVALAPREAPRLVRRSR
ncbi:helix-turn-helix domain-containing protein [Methylocystis heyeri]|uniref:Helix-turn-helix domain-containing protein n=1 Tax=Methylocystis heyeri TaxID=391905 RepID=A0A6B8KGD1_9HYPH|nr:XRE family transcriptional regulator [Methylocystis heyeri]QGM46035.1 helix-turn-helix domain-containing protein [Methylocystis heyeri]